MQVLICDDSGMARKQMLRALPTALSGQVSFAANGVETLDLLSNQPFDLLLLDLTMPIMDGYATLEAMRQRGLNCPTLVVSADIQPQARQRVMDLGALAFLQKPVQPAALQHLLAEQGLWQGKAPVAERADHELQQTNNAQQRELPHDCLREVANVAMGRAADKLARLLGTFINLPIPRVAMLDKGELAMTLAALADGRHVAVSQGFVGRGLTAEALLSTDLAGRDGLSQLMRLRDCHCGDSDSGPVLDAANILTGAFLTGFGQLLDLDFSKSQPVLLDAGHYNAEAWSQRIDEMEATLTIEIPYHFEREDFICDLLLLFPGTAGEHILERAGYLNEA